MIEPLSSTKIGALRELVAGGRQARPVVDGELAGAQPLRLDLGLAAHQPLRHLGLRHLEREQPHGHSVADAEVRGHAEAERRLPHARARREDDEVAGLEPGGDWSSCRNPDGVPVISTPASYSCVMRSKLCLSSASMWLKSSLVRCWESSKIDLLGAVDEVDGLAGPLPAQARDLAAGLDEAAQDRHLADDARVVAGVRRRGDERRQLVQADAAADVLELAALLELVDQGDRVDRLALRVQRDGGAVDLGVALAVEVARVEDLADDADGAGREHHRAKDGLLRVEVLRRDDRLVPGLQSLGHRGLVKPRRRQAATCGRPPGCGGS